MTGFICAVVGEILTGRGALGQLQLETRLPQTVINLGVVAIVVRTGWLASHACHLIAMPACAGLSAVR